MLRVKIHDEEMFPGACQRANRIDFNRQELSFAMCNNLKLVIYNMYVHQVQGDSGMIIDIGIIPVFPWKVIKEKDKMCVATQSLSGWIPVGCKYIKEPYPISIYADFMDVNPEQITQDYNNVLS